MPDFEHALVNAFNRFFEAEGIDAVAFRLKQSRFTPQPIDILVDSKFPEFYLAIECKSIDALKTHAIYFRQHFSIAGGDHQLEREDEFVRRSGRTGLLAVELRRGAGRPREAHLLPWHAVIEPFRAGEAALSIERIASYQQIPRSGGVYAISHEIIERIRSSIPPDPDSGSADIDSSDLELDAD